MRYTANPTCTRSVLAWSSTFHKLRKNIHLRSQFSICLTLQCMLTLVLCIYYNYVNQLYTECAECLLSMSHLEEHRYLQHVSISKYLPLSLNMLSPTMSLLSPFSTRVHFDVFQMKQQFVDKKNIPTEKYK